jgi:DNA repair protein RadC
LFLSIKNLPPDDQPREKIWEKGVATLSVVELLAVLLRTGSKNNSVLDLARSLAGTPEKLAALRTKKPAALAHEKGIGPAKAVTIAAALELGRRLADTDLYEKKIVKNTSDAVAILMPRLRDEEKEIFSVIMLNAKGQVLAVEKIAQGSQLSAVVVPREVFQAALMHRAIAIVLSHNHPSGDPQPSGEDKELTQRLVDAGRIMGILVVDHIIIGAGIYYSFSEEGLI